MTFLEGLIRARFDGQRSRVERLSHGGWRVSVDYSEKDIEWARHENSRAAMRELIAPLEARPKRQRRLHWGRCRPRSGVLRLEQRGRHAGVLAYVPPQLGAP